MADLRLERELVEKFRYLGLTLRADGLRYLAGAVRAAGDGALVRRVVELLEKQPPPSALVTEAYLRASVDGILRLERSPADLESASLAVLDAFEALPRLRYDTARRAYTAAVVGGAALHAEAGRKVELVQERYESVRQRVARSPEMAGVELTSIEALAGAGPGERTVLGVLSRTPGGGWSLEDPHARVGVDLSGGAAVTDGMMPDGCVVLVTGEVREGELAARAVGLPPPEPRERTLAALGPSVDHFGGLPPPALRESLARFAEEHTGASVLFVSDAWLDCDAVTRGLRALLAGYEADVAQGDEYPPSALVLMGNFTSRPLPANARRALFAQLGELVATEAPLLSKRMRLVLVPGPSDVPGALPRQKLPRALAGPLLDRLPNAVLATNPCRMRLCAQEIVVFREDIVNKMRRNCGMPLQARDHDEISRHFVRTVCDQGHLCPMQLCSAPVHWNYDHALSISPLPHLVVVGDQCAKFGHSYAGTLVGNPGPFSHDGVFLKYMPHQRQMVNLYALGDAAP
eukprot:m51a1_g8555 hypothetical protein (518) ;mRNA; f:146752-148395